jgi:hypothetical protein
MGLLGSEEIVLMGVGVGRTISRKYAVYLREMTDLVHLPYLSDQAVMRAVLLQKDGVRLFQLEVSPPRIEC